MSEVSGTRGMCMAFCVHPMCSNYKTTNYKNSTCWLYFKNKSSHILNASQVQVSYLGQCMRGKSRTSTWLTSRVFEYIVTLTQLWLLQFIDKLQCHQTVSKMDFRDFHRIMKPSLRGNLIIIMIILEGLRNIINCLQLGYSKKLSHSASRDFKTRYI